MEAAISNMVEKYERGKITRRQLVQGLVLLAAGTRARGAQGGSTFKGIGINHLALDVTDVQRSRDFYRQHLGAPVIHESSADCFLGLGKNFLTLFKRDRPALDHFCIAIENFNVKAVTAELKRRGLNPDQPSGTNRVYFRDPDGLMVQLSPADHWPS